MLRTRAFLAVAAISMLAGALLHAVWKQPSANAQDAQNASESSAAELWQPRDCRSLPGGRRRSGSLPGTRGYRGQEGRHGL